MERPVAAAAALNARAPSSAIARTTSPFRLHESDRHVVATVLECVPEELGEDERERRRTLAGERDGLELRGDLLADDEPLDEHRAQPVDSSPR